MDEKRRFFLSAMIPGAVLATAALVTAQQPQFPQNPPPQLPPPFPKLPSPPTKAQLQANRKEIKKDVDRLFSLAQDLKEEAGKTNTVDVLSVAFVQKTEQIEKLAKKIRDLARD